MARGISLLLPVVTTIEPYLLDKAINSVPRMRAEYFLPPYRMARHRIHRQAVHEHVEHGLMFL
jgi:hypothetical protein